MPHRNPEPRERGAAAPFLWIEMAEGNVEVWALGEDRFGITAPGHEQLGTGFRGQRRGRTRWLTGSGNWVAPAFVPP